VRLYEAKGKDKDKAGFAAFVDGHTLVVSPSKEYVLDSIAKSTGKKDGKPGKDMLALLEKASPKDAVSLTFLIPDEAKLMLANNPQTATFASKLESVTGSVGVTDGIQADIQVHTADAKAAEEVRKIIDAVKGLLVLGVKDNKEYGPMLSDIIDNLKVTSEKSTVTISAKASADQIDKGIKKNPKSDKDK